MADLVDLVKRLIEAKLKGERPQAPPAPEPVAPPPLPPMRGLPPEVLLAHGKLFGPGAKWGGPGQNKVVPGDATPDEWAMSGRPRSKEFGQDVRLK